MADLDAGLGRCYGQTPEEIRRMVVWTRPKLLRRALTTFWFFFGLVWVSLCSQAGLLGVIILRPCCDEGLLGKPTNQVLSRDYWRPPLWRGFEREGLNLWQTLSHCTFQFFFDMVNLLNQILIGAVINFKVSFTVKVQVLNFKYPSNKTILFFYIVNVTVPTRRLARSKFIVNWRDNSNWWHWGQIWHRRVVNAASVVFSSPSLV